VPTRTATRTRTPPGTLLALLLLLVSTACYQRFHEIQAVETAQGVVFELPEVAAGMQKGHAYELLDLTVTKRDCTGQCTLWFLVRQTPSVGSANLESARIVYGIGPEGMEHRTRAQALPASSYAVAATVQQYDATGGLVDSLSMEGSFSVSSPSSPASDERGMGDGPPQGDE
jgi:hypothetical protein